MKKNIIEVDNLNFSFNSNENIFEKVSFKINKGDLVAIVGHNGSGKSTLVKLLTGLIETKKKSKIKVNGKLSYIPQKYNQDVNFPAKVKEILELECCDCSLRDRVVKDLNISNLLDKQFKSLSGGQQQRVLITLSVLSNPDILILDEPTVGFDTKTQENFYSLLKSLNEERNLTILFVTHDTGMVSDYFTKILFVHNRNICLDDAKKTTHILNKTYGNHFHQIEHNHSHGGKK